LDGVHRSETCVVPVSVTDSTGAVGGRRSASADSGAAQRRAAATTAAPRDFAASFCASIAMAFSRLTRPSRLPLPRTITVVPSLPTIRGGLCLFVGSPSAAESALRHPTAEGSACHSFTRVLSPMPFSRSPHRQVVRTRPCEACRTGGAPPPDYPRRPAHAYPRALPGKEPGASGETSSDRDAWVAIFQAE
jgi:hypothetical protein